MRKIIAGINLTLDGFTEGPNGELDWSMADADLLYANDFLQQFDTMLYGRVAYEKVGFPRPTDLSLPEPLLDYNLVINNMRKYVFSRIVKHVDGNGMIISGDIRSEVERIRDEIGKDIWLCGGPMIVQVLARLDLIDEYVLMIKPVILGAGKPLFQTNDMYKSLRLVHTLKLKSGLTILKYIPTKRNTKLMAL